MRFSHILCTEGNFLEKFVSKHGVHRNNKAYWGGGGGGSGGRGKGRLYGSFSKLDQRGCHFPSEIEIILKHATF